MAQLGTSLPMFVGSVCNATTNQQYYTQRSLLLPIQRNVKQKNRKRIRAIIISITAGGFFSSDVIRLDIFFCFIQRPPALHLTR